MTYESFDNNKRKIEKNWNKVESNTDDLKTIPIITLDFNSIGFTKKITTIPIVTSTAPLPISPLNKVTTILLVNFPEWALNMVEPSVIYTIDDGFVSSLIDTNLQEANVSGTLKNDDVAIQSQNWHYWFNRVDQRNFFLKIFYNIRVLQAIKSPGSPGFSANNVPVFADISLKLYNQRIYEVMNEKFE